MTNRIEGDLFVDGVVRATGYQFPVGEIEDADIKALAGVQATKLQHQHALMYRQNESADVVSETVPIWIVRGASALAVSIEAACPVAPAGGDKQVTVDLQKGNAATPFTSILQSVLTIDDTKSDRQVVTGTITSADLVDGDQLRLVITAGGSTGTQAQGLVVTVTVREDAE